jgi:hypothetical protein
MAKRAPKQVSDSQKQAMAAGRADSRIVKSYLEALDEHRPKRGRKRSPETIKKRLDEIENSIQDADPLRRVTLIQQRIDLANELERLETTVDITALEKSFIGVARGYGERKGISYAAWREVGVSAEVLKAAGISRAS